MALNMDPVLVGGLSALICVPLVRLLFKKLKLFQPSPQEQNISFELLTKKYTKWAYLSGIPMLIFAVGFSCLWYILFINIALFTHKHLPIDIYTLYSSKYIWMIESLFFGILSSFIPTSYLLKIFLKERYSEYSLFLSTVSGVDEKQFAKYFSIFLVSITVILLPFLLNYYVRVTESELIINRFAKFHEEKYGYKRIKDIRYYKAFGRKEPYYEIEFDNGYIWSTKNNAYDFPATGEKDIMQFVSLKSNKPIKAQ